MGVQIKEFSLRKARRLLRDPDLTEREIATEVFDYSSHSGFIAAYRRYSPDHETRKTPGNSQKAAVFLAAVIALVTSSAVFTATEAKLPVQVKSPVHLQFISASSVTMSTTQAGLHPSFSMSRSIHHVPVSALHIENS
jgi:hypothetical protein